jgi:geranylgeranyl diphosphate synthase, type I
MTTIAATSKPHSLEAALASFQGALERELEGQLKLADESSIDPRWSRALVELRSFSLRPGKRVRPLLTVVGYGLATGDLLGAPEGVQRFAAGLELLHTFMLVHDDVADRAPTRRGGPALHHLLGGGKAGEDLAVVMGDHLYARALEVMLGCGMAGAAAATQFMLGVCRTTAAGQFLDIDLSRAPLSEVSLFQTLKVAHLKTARYGFVAPLVTGAMLGGASAELLESLERVGRQVGLAFQLNDDLIGLFGDESVAGKAGGADYVEGKRTFPVIAAWTRADEKGRAELEHLWGSDDRPRFLSRARDQLRAHGGDSATTRVVQRLTRSARRGLAGLPSGGGARSVLDQVVAKLERRAA